jgi:DNA transformation protein
MATRQDTVDFILGQIDGAGDVSARKMFGEYAIYCDGRTVALVCDDQLYVKPTASGSAFASPFETGSPFPGAKPWLLISEQKCLDRNWLSRLIRLSTAEIPLPLEKKKKPKKTPRTAR